MVVVVVVKDSTSSGSIVLLVNVAVVTNLNLGRFKDTPLAMKL